MRDNSYTPNTSKYYIQATFPLLTQTKQGKLFQIAFVYCMRQLKQQQIFPRLHKVLVG